MDISIKCMPIAADRFTITVSLILLRYTMVRTVVCSRVPRYGFCRRYPTLVVNGEYSILFNYGSVMSSKEIPEGHGNTRAATETAPGCMGCDPQEAGK